tara:strand:+ start:898 stop:1443 length:546 start_codon:yes stop_codon:yes gene_type:complete
MKTQTYTVKYRRKREGKTNYKKRLGYLKSENPRLVIRKSLNNVNVQIIAFQSKGDKILASGHSKELQKYGWKNIRSNLPTAYLTGLLAGKKAMKNKVDTAVLDIGFNVSVKGSKMYAAVKGLIDAGMKLNVPENMLPSDQRVSGKHIEGFEAKSENQFSKYTDKEKLTQQFSEVKDKILKV